MVHQGCPAVQVCLEEEEVLVIQALEDQRESLARLVQGVPWGDPGETV